MLRCSDLSEIHCEATVLPLQRNTVPTNLLLTEQRTPGEPMRPLPLRLPAAQLDRLNGHAKRLRCYPTALARALVCRGLDQIEVEEG